MAHAILIYLPGEAGILLRRQYYSKRLKKCGTDLVVKPGVIITGKEYIEVGNNVMIRENVIINTSIPSKENERRDIKEIGNYTTRDKGIIKIGSNSRIAFGALLLGYGGIKIGEKCGIGPRAILLSESFHHQGSNRKKVYKYSQGANQEEQCVLRGYIELLDGAGIASNVVVLPGATIGKDSWVSPNSLVRVGGYIEDNVIAKGDPAKPIFNRPYANL